MNPKYKIGDKMETLVYGDIEIIDILKSETRFCYLITTDGIEYLVFEHELFP